MKNTQYKPLPEIIEIKEKEINVWMIITIILLLGISIYGLFIYSQELEQKLVDEGYKTGFSNGTNLTLMGLLEQTSQGNIPFVYNGTIQWTTINQICEVEQ